VSWNELQPVEVENWTVAPLTLWAAAATTNAVKKFENCTVYKMDVGQD
jgi:hypothetical protein